jgi:hypothetical protein
VRISPVLLAAMLASGSAAAAPIAPVKPWVLDNDCDCWLSRVDGHSHRASISRDWANVSMGLSDFAFDPWPQSDAVRVEVMFNHDPKRRVSVEGSISHLSGAPTMLGFSLDAGARRALGGATRIEVLQDGKTVVDLPLAETPSQAQLDFCVPPPRTKDSDSED